MLRVQLSPCGYRSLCFQKTDVVQYGHQSSPGCYALNLQRFQRSEEVNPLMLIVNVETAAPNWQVVRTDEVLDGFIVEIFDVHIQVTNQLLWWMFVVRRIVRSGHID